MTDPISDMLNRIRTAQAVKKETVEVPFSAFMEEILGLLEKEGFVSSVEKKGKKVEKYIEVGIKYENNRPRIQGSDRVSKLSRRVYKGVKELRPIKNGYGIMVLSTPKGVMTDITARKEGVGGEALFVMW